jgi:hypothetical protein
MAPPLTTPEAIPTPANVRTMPTLQQGERVGMTSKGAPCGWYGRFAHRAGGGSGRRVQGTDTYGTKSSMVP